MAVCKNCNKIFLRTRGSRAKLCDACWQETRNKAYGTTATTIQARQKQGSIPLWIKIKGRGM